MEIKDKKTFETFEKWLKESGKKVFIIHDSDGDGISSGKLMVEALEKLGKEVVGRFVALNRHAIFNMDLLDLLVKTKANTLVFTDLDITATDYNDMKEHLSEFDIIVFDHHQPQVHEENNVIYFHPIPTYGFDEPAQFCTAQLVWQVMNNFTDLSEWDWVMSIGTISDMNYKTWGELVDKTLKRYNMEITEDIFDSRMAKVGHMLFNARSMADDSIIDAAKDFVNAKTWEEAEKKLAKYNIVDEEINSFMNNWEKHSEQVDDIIFVDLNTKYSLGSIISTKISLIKEAHTVIVFRNSDKQEDMVNLSLRRQDRKVDLPKVIGKVAEHLIDCSGGGHDVASGARCRKEDKEEFKKLFSKYHGEFRK